MKHQHSLISPMISSISVESMASIVSADKVAKPEYQFKDTKGFKMR